MAVAMPFAPAAAGQLQENHDQVREWNQFARRLLAIHQHWKSRPDVRIEERFGGYGNHPNFYRQVDVRLKSDGRLLSSVQWEREKPDNLHTVEVYFYDAKGRVNLDYRVAYLPKYRNAPMHTNISVHYRDADLWAFRQFDASGIIIYETCRGEHFDKKVDISLDDYQLPPDPEEVPADLYVACFGFLPLRADDLFNPVDRVPGLTDASRAGQGDDDNEASLRWRIDRLSAGIATEPNNAKLYAFRGREYFLLEKFDAAIADFNTALKLDDTIDAAYFGRGMALGRAGKLEDGIRDLGVYIKRHPGSSLAYTKRGVRHIWNRDFANAREDLEKAVDLDENNAEAHDDLGVVLAKNGDLDAAVSHFQRARAIDPGYQKVHHNLAMVHYMRHDHEKALSSVDRALKLQAANRASLMLKSTILDALGRGADAARVKQRAEQLPEGNWSERSGL